LARRRRASRARRVFSCARNDAGIASTRPAAARASSADTRSFVSSAVRTAFDTAFRASSAPATCGTSDGRNAGRDFKRTSRPHSNVFANATSSARRLRDARVAAEALARAAAAVFSWLRDTPRASAATPRLAATNGTGLRPTSRPRVSAKLNNALASSTSGARSFARDAAWGAGRAVVGVSVAGRSFVSRDRVVSVSREKERVSVRAAPL
jgi:hypothetical protein